MDVLETIKSRRSVRAYKPEEVEKEKIEQVIEAGIWAPNGFNQQPWKFIVVNNKERIDEIDTETYEVLKDVTEQISPKSSYGAPVLILVGANKGSIPSYPLDCAFATENMMLYAHAIGLGTCPMGWIVQAANMSNKIRKILKVDEDFDIIIGIALGYPSQVPENPGRKDLQEVIEWV